jgi:hypothetical protein
MSSRPSELHKEIRGFRVIVDNTRPDIATSSVLERLDDALALIAQYEPWRLAHMRRDISAFVIARYPYRGAFDPDSRSCLTELTFLARRDITAAPVAAMIVNLATQARIMAAQSAVMLDDEHRVAHSCRRAELQFGKALPPHLGTPVIEHAMMQLVLPGAGAVEDIDWDEAARRMHAIDDEALRRDRGTETQS